MKRKNVIFIIVAVVLFVTGISLALIKGNSTPTKSVAKNTPQNKFAIVLGAIADEDLAILEMDVSKEADLIIRGETIDYKGYMEDPRNIWTTEKVRVLECIRGDVAVGDVIEIDKMGGYVLMSEFIEAYSELDRQVIRNTEFAQYSDSQLASEYISVEVVDDANIAIGKISMFYLRDNGDHPYSRVAGKRGEIVEVDGSGIAHSSGNIQASQTPVIDKTPTPAITNTPHPSVISQPSIIPEQSVTPEPSITPQPNITPEPSITPLNALEEQ